MRRVLHWVNLNQNMIESYGWLLLAVPTLLWWKDSVTWVALMSIYANAKTAAGAHHAKMAERNGSA